jgi:hypothetical protein
MSKHTENTVPDMYWNEISQTEREDAEMLRASADELERYLSQTDNEWMLMDNEYYSHLRERFKKGPDDIGPRQFKQFQNQFLPLQIMVIPAGRQHNGEAVVHYFHTIIEDMEYGDCNGVYELITEADLEEKFNIKYNN